MTDTHCPYCALQCAMTLQRPGAAGSSAREADPLEVQGRDFPTNRGGLCTKGWTATALLAAPSRVVEPLRRTADGGFEIVAWEDALDGIAERLRSLRADHGADAVGVFGGGGLTNEKAYQLGKFARVALGTSRIDYNGRYCMSSAAAAGNRAFGIDRGLPFPVADLDSARMIVLVGSNVAETMPPFIGHLEGARAAGGLVVIDPRRSVTAKLTATGAGVHLQPTPGSDLVLLLGLLHVVIAESLVDEPYVAARTNGFDRVAGSVGAWWPERVQSITGVPAAQLREVAHRLAEGDAYIITGRGVEQHADGTDTTTAAINLALALGLPGRPGSGYGTLTGQGNGQGGREHGQKADQLPGYRRIDDPAARSHVAAVWGVDAASLPGPGIPATALLNSMGEPGGLRALLVHGSNLVVSSPNVDRVRAGLAALDLLVVCDFFLSETAALADYVLPVTQWAEEEGTMTTLEGRVIRRRRAIAPPAGARTELWIMAELARRLQAPSTWRTEPRAVFDELCRATAGGPADYSGMSYELLDGDEPVHWPYPVGSRGTPRLFAERFAHADGRARFVAVAPVPRSEPLHGEGRLALITGRLLEHYQSGAQTRRVPELQAARPEARAQLHPATATRLGIVDGAWVELANRRGTVRVRASVDVDIRHDTVFLPFHFAAEQCANLLTADVVDPVSGMPEFKATDVVVRPVPLEAIA